MLNPAQVNYTITEQELLSILEILKEFRHILLGQQIKVYIDHKNVTYKTFNTERVIRLRLILEEYNPELLYIQASKNIAASTLSSRLDIVDTYNSIKPNKSSLTEHFSLEKEYVLHPVKHRRSAKLNKIIQLRIFMGQIRNVLLTQNCDP